MMNDGIISLQNKDEIVLLTFLSLVHTGRKSACLAGTVKLLVSVYSITVYPTEACLTTNFW